MTTQQQNIIDSLVAEFNKINTPVHNGFARLGEVLEKCDEWKCLVAGVEASNARFEYLRESMIERDCARLKEECRLAGINLRIEEKSDSIVIDNHSKYGSTDNALRISYNFVTRYHNSNGGQSIKEITSVVYQSYKASSDGRFSSIENLFLDNNFFYYWSKLIEKSRE